MSETAHVGPIVFSNDHARAQLVEYGEVVTFRSDRTTGDTWWRKSRTGPKRGDVIVEEITPVEPTEDALRQYCDQSGFPTIRDWREAIIELHGNTSESGHLYRVTMSDTDE